MQRAPVVKLATTYENTTLIHLQSRQKLEATAKKVKFKVGGQKNKI